SPNDLIHTAAERDAAPFQCGGITFTNDPDPHPDYVTLTGGAATQTITLSTVPPGLHLSDGPLTITATASAGQPVAITTTTPAICTPSGDSIVPLASGSCRILLVQAGIPDQLHATSIQLYTTVVTGMNAGPIYSSAQTGLLSYLRFYNTGTT